MSPTLAEELRAIGLESGLDQVGVCDASEFAETRVALQSRKADGLHADMQFTYRNPERATTPTVTLPGARSLVVGALSYRRTEPQPEPGLPTARVAEYVWEPYYVRLHDALDQIADHLRGQGWKTRVLVDDNALVDRAAAHRAGIGWYGKNSNILIPGKGSRFVLGSVVTDAPLESNLTPVADACGTCRRCIDACPTDAIVADGTIDANRCLAWLVQAKGVFPREFRIPLGDRIYGCDDCQSTCPPNVTLDRKSKAELTTGDAWVSVSDLLELDDDALLERFGAWYIPGREARYLRRNALIVLANTADPASKPVRSLVERFATSGDDIERSHAIWAAHQLGYNDLVEDARSDENELVAAELAAIDQTAA